jgi:hypothetical protein
MVIWDAFNVIGTNTGGDDKPPGSGATCWTATPSPDGHAGASLGGGHLGTGVDIAPNLHVALQIL